VTAKRHAVTLEKSSWLWRIYNLPVYALLRYGSSVDCYTLVFSPSFLLGPMSSLLLLVLPVSEQPYCSTAEKCKITSKEYQWHRNKTVSTSRTTSGQINAAKGKAARVRWLHSLSLVKPPKKHNLEAK
jgi:hypothetical protein